MTLRPAGVGPAHDLGLHAGLRAPGSGGNQQERRFFERDELIEDDQVVFRREVIRGIGRRLTMAELHHRAVGIPAHLRRGDGRRAHLRRFGFDVSEMRLFQFLVGPPEQEHAEPRHRHTGVVADFPRAFGLRPPSGAADHEICRAIRLLQEFDHFDLPRDGNIATAAAFAFEFHDHRVLHLPAPAGFLRTRPRLEPENRDEPFDERAATPATAGQRADLERHQGIPFVPLM
jgi:hypothetical protein